ncbi:MAG: hypothetical protein WC906_02320 [Parcubacteria group bacterium]
MDINKKIEEIRQKPERIRLQYVWSLVSISMFFIIIIWIFSLGESIKKIPTTDTSALPDIKQNLDEMQSLKDTAPSIDEMAGDAQPSELQNSTSGQNLTNEVIQPTQNIPVPPNEKSNKTLPPKQ